MQTVLLVEPDADDARRNAESLQRAGFRVEVIAPGVQKPDLAPDVVVLSVARLDRSLLPLALHGHLGSRIAISSETTDAPRAAEFGCAAVLVRPVMYDELVTAVRRALKQTADHVRV